MTQPELSFDGATFDQALDGKRLGAQLRIVHAVMFTGKWFSLADLAWFADCPEASASARLRDLRKAKFGGHKIDRRRVPGGNGLHEYRLVKP